MTGLEGPAASLGTKLAIAAAKRFFRSNEFDRLCERLAERFGDRVPYTARDYALWADVDAFSAALGRYVTPPHDFDRDALVAAITPLVGPVDSRTSADAFAGQVADAIHDELRLAKTGDALTRFEADRVIAAIESIADESASTSGGIDLRWAPPRAESQLRRVAAKSAAAAKQLEQALAGRDLGHELPGLVAEPPRWLRDADAETWRFIARLAELKGLWPVAQDAYERMADAPDADRARAFMGASGAAGFAGNPEAATDFHSRARRIRHDHPLVQLVDISAEDDPSTRLALLDRLGEPQEDEYRGLALALRAIALLDLERVEDAEPLATFAEHAAPELAVVREAQLAVTVARNRQLRAAGVATERRKLLQTAEGYRRLRDELRESRRLGESAGMLQRVADCQMLADRPDLARETLGEVLDEELAAGGHEVLLLTEAALGSGDPSLAETLLAHYTGEDPAAELLGAQLMLRDPERRAKGIAIFDGRVAHGDHVAARLRLMAAVPSTGEVPWSDDAETLLNQTEPVLVSFLKAERHDRAGRPDQARRELARHATDPRALEELMGHFAERDEWEKAVAPARALLRTGPRLRSRVAAAQVLNRAGENHEAEEVLRNVLAHPDVHDEEYRVAFGELTDQLLRADRNVDARAVAEQAAERGEPSTSWIIAYTFAREGDTAAARKRIEGLHPRGLGDVLLAAEMHFAEDEPPDALRSIVALADELDQPHERVELLATLSLLRVPDGTDISDELARRASPDRFVERFPGSSSLRRLDFSDAKDVVELVSGMAERRARAARDAESRVLEAGHAPVGFIAGAVGHTLAEVWAQLPRLPLAYPDVPLDDELQAVSAAAGGSVVVDTAALYTLQLLGDDLTDTVLAEFPLSEKTQSTLDDIIRAVTVDLSSGSGTANQVAWDSASGNPVWIEQSAEDARAPKRAAERMRRIAARLQTSRTLTPFDDADERAEGASLVARAYIETVDAARRANRPVYSDDRSFRKSLADAGIKTFGTLALLRALTDTGAISEAAQRDALERLRERRTLGLG
jgi:hypothetical protein